MAHHPVTCPYCGYEFKPAPRHKPGIMVICANCEHCQELAGPPRLLAGRLPLPRRRESMHRCRLDGLPVSETAACQDRFRPSRAAIERFGRCGC